MDRAKELHGIFLDFAIIASTISSLAILAAALVELDGKNKIILIAAALIFWLGLILEQIMIWQANHLLNRKLKKDDGWHKRRIGIFSVAACGEGLIADIVLLMSIMALFFCHRFSIGETLIQYVLVCLIVLSFRMHCILNGKNYIYKKLLRER